MMMMAVMQTAVKEPRANVEWCPKNYGSCESWDPVPTAAQNPVDDGISQVVDVVAGVGFETAKLGNFSKLPTT